MGREYARATGEPDEVALAIFEHYLPRGAGRRAARRATWARWSASPIGSTRSSASSASASRPPARPIPSACAAPASAIIHVVLARGYRFSLSGRSTDALAAARAQARRSRPRRRCGRRCSTSSAAACGASGREEHRADVVEAVLSAGFDDLVAARDAPRRRGLDARRRGVPRAGGGLLPHQHRGEGARPSRCDGVDAALFEKPAEGALYESFLAARRQVRRAARRRATTARPCGSSPRCGSRSTPSSPR